MNLTRPLVIAKKELLQLRRDRLTLGMMVALPVMQLLLFGYAINNDVRHIPTIVFDQDESATSRDLALSLTATGFYDVVGAARDYAEVDLALRSSIAKVALIVPAGYERDIVGRRPVTVRLVLDGSDPQTVASATNTAASLVAARSGQLTVQRLAAAGLPAITTIPLPTTVRYPPHPPPGVPLPPWGLWHPSVEPFRRGGGLGCLTVGKWRFSSATRLLSAPPASTLAT